jgi:trimeric autotransporter adhesin
MPQPTTAIQFVRDSFDHGRSGNAGRHRVLLTGLAIAFFGLSPTAQTAPRPDGDIGNGNTAGGSGALFSLTTGTNNTANGYRSLYTLTTATANTGNGWQSLFSNTTGYSNTADGFGALLSNTAGAANTASGAQALYNNTVGNENTAAGSTALGNNTTGNQNTAVGGQALYTNTTGFQNTGAGDQALYTNTSGNFNTAYGFEALYLNTTGSYNIALGYYVGANLTTGSYNIDIGNPGVAGESGTIRIGTAGNHTATFIAGITGTTVAAGTAVVADSNGQLGTIVSSKRFKEEIKPMDTASEAILALKPVTFRYKHVLDPKGIAQFGLVAEEVEKVNPALVVRDAEGKVYSVRYEAINAMLLNEFLKEHRKMQEMEINLAQLKSEVARQEKNFQTTATLQHEEIKALTANLKAQASQIQKVSAELEVSKPAPQVVGNNQ